MPKLLFFYFAGIAVVTESCVPNSQQLRRSIQLIIHHAGKYADFFILDENPLVDIHATQRIHGVVLRGGYWTVKIWKPYLYQLGKKEQK